MRSTMRSIRFLLGSTLVLGLALGTPSHAASAVPAKKCKALCKTEDANCVAQQKNKCTGLKGKPKQTCKAQARKDVRDCKKTVHQACLASTNTSVCF